MENLAIARIFSEIADLLEIKSENPFKIRAYRNASETIAHATEKLAYLHRRAAARHSRHRQGARVEDPRDRRNRRGALSPGSARAVSADDTRPAPPSGRRSQNRRAALYRARHQDDRGARGGVRRRPRARAEGPGPEEGAAHSPGVRRAEAAYGPPSPARCRRGRGAAARLPARGMPDGGVRQRRQHPPRRRHVGRHRHPRDGRRPARDVDVHDVQARRADSRSGRNQVERSALGRHSSRSPARARGEPRRGHAVFHRIEVAQHRAARPRDRARAQAERVRAVSRR